MMDCNTHNCHMNQSYDGLNDLALGIAYVPWQTFKQVFDADDGLSHGTIFAELCKPFDGKGGKGCCRMGGAHE